MTTNKKTKFLTANNSFLSGMARVLDIGSTRNKHAYRVLKSSDEADKIAISNDWSMVLGQDIWGNMRNTKTLVFEQTNHTRTTLPPSLLKQFDDIIPDGADRIMKMAESQTAHRIKMEESVVRTRNITSFLGVLFGGFIVLVVIIGAIYLIN